ncbi:MAG: chalcone isomerase family protein [Desulfobulbia bacterium]
MHASTRYFLSALLFLALIPSAAIGSVDSMTLISKGDAHYMGFIKVYDAQLYAFAKQDQARILSSEVSKCLKLNYKIGLKPKDFIAGASTVLGRQHPPEYLDLIKPHVDALHSAYRAVDKGDFYLLCYDADSGLTTLSLNAEKLVAIDSGEFSSAYFGIWLSPNNPLSPALQKQLAGPEDS